MKIKRPLVTILVGILIGIIYGLYLKISIAINIILISILYIGFYYITKRKSLIYFLVRNKKGILIIFISSIISNTYLNLLDNYYEKIYKSIPQKIETVATIISGAEETEYYYKYNIKISNKKFIMYISKNYNKNLKYGMTIKIKGEYKEPEESRNYKGFNYKEYLKTKKVYGSIYVGKVDVNKENDLNYVLMLNNKIRKKIIETIGDISTENTRGLLEGKLIGKTDNLSDSIKSDFRDSSLSHIIAISGSHISYIIIGISYCFTKSKIPKKRIYIITIILLIAFMFITNFSASIVRACIMGITMLFSKILYRKLDILSSMSVSLLILLIYNPFLINDIGLQLSYLGTLGIILLYEPIVNFLQKHINKKIAEIFALTISAQVLILPIILIHFNNFSTIFLISNLLATPLSGTIILLGYANVIIGILFDKLGKFIGIFTNGVAQILIWIAEYTSKIPFANIIVKTPSILIVIGYYILIYCITKKQMKKVAIVIFMLAIIITNIFPINFINLKIHFIDVGQRR